MRIRKLELRDATHMWEWMHDKELTANLQTQFNSISLDDCKTFILKSREDAHNLHMAAVDNDDVYMGTVSLKNIDNELCSAEFAIAFRRCALGTGISGYAMKEILRYGLQELGLKQIYWYVSRENIRAVRFYDKCGYPRVAPETLRIPASSSVGKMANMLFYAVTAAQFKD